MKALCYHFFDEEMNVVIVLSIVLIILLLLLLLQKWQVYSLKTQLAEISLVHNLVSKKFWIEMDFPKINQVISQFGGAKIGQIIVLVPENLIDVLRQNIGAIPQNIKTLAHEIMSYIARVYAICYGQKLLEMFKYYLIATLNSNMTISQMVRDLLSVWVEDLRQLIVGLMATAMTQFQNSRFATPTTEFVAQNIDFVLDPNKSLLVAIVQNIYDQGIEAGLILDPPIACELTQTENGSV